MKIIVTMISGREHTFYREGDVRDWVKKFRTDREAYTATISFSVSGVILFTAQIESVKVEE